MLSLLGFLLLLAPFYDSCDMKIIEATNATCADSTAVEVDSVRIDKTEISKTVVDTVFTAKEATFCNKAYDFIVDDESFTGFEIAGLTFLAIEDITFKEIEFAKAFEKKGWYKDLGLFISFLFDFIVLISFSLLILSFFKKQNLFTKLALTNCILVIITFCYVVFFESSFQHLHQIKWGYYAFIITNILIFCYSKKNKSKS